MATRTKRTRKVTSPLLRSDAGGRRKRYDRILTMAKQGKTNEEIGARLGLTGERVRQIRHEGSAYYRP